MCIASTASLQLKRCTNKFFSQVTSSEAKSSQAKPSQVKLNLPQSYESKYLNFLLEQRLKRFELPPKATTQRY